MVNFFESDNEVSGLIRDEDYPAQLRKYSILKKGPAPWSWLVGWLVLHTKLLFHSLPADNEDLHITVQSANAVSDTTFEKYMRR